MILYNQEHCIDPTAGTAICHVMAEEIRKKRMERLPENPIVVDG